MASFIVVEPSCDIHLVLAPGFRRDDGTPLNNLELRVFAADWNGTTYDRSVITSDLEFDFFDPSASTRSPAAGALPSTIAQNRINQAIVGHAFNPATAEGELKVKVELEDDTGEPTPILGTRDGSRLEFRNASARVHF